MAKKKDTSKVVEVDRKGPSTKANKSFGKSKPNRVGAYNQSGYGAGVGAYNG